MSQTKSIIAENPARKVRYLELAKTSDEKFILKEMFPFLEEKGIDISNFRIDIINFIMSYTLKTYRFIRMLHRTYEAESVVKGHKDEYKLHDFFYFLIEALSNQLNRHDISYKKGLNKDRTTLEEMIKKYRTTNDIVIDDVLSIYLVNLFLNEPNKTLDMIQSETIKENLKVFYFKLFAEDANFAPSEEVMSDILYFCKMDFNDIRNMFSVYRRLPDVLSKKSNWTYNTRALLPTDGSLKDAVEGYIRIDRLQLLKSSLDSQTGAFADFVHYQGMFPLDKKFDSITLSSKEYVSIFIKKLRHTEWNYYLSEAYGIYKEYLKSYLKQLELPRSERTAMYDVSFSAVTGYLHALEGMFEDGSFAEYIEGVEYVREKSEARNIPVFKKPLTIEYLLSDKIFKAFVKSKMELFNSHDYYSNEEVRLSARRSFENNMDDYERHSSVNPYKVQEQMTAYIARFQGRSFTKNQLDWGDRFKTYDDGLFWEFLPDGRSDKERHAMNHCGNMGRINDIMYSLRSEKKGKYKVHVTVTVSSDGYLLETKSYGNNEPSEKYHKHLIDLYISSPYIKCVGNEYDGFKPEVNFTFHKFNNIEKRKVQKEISLASINKYSIYESLISDVEDYIKENPDDKDSNEFVFYEGTNSGDYVEKEILFHNHIPLLVLNLVQIGNEIEDRMGVFPYHLQKISLLSYIDSKEMFIKILDELVSYFYMNTGSKQIMIPNSFMINLNEIITTLPREWEDDIVSSKAIEKIKEINKHFEEDFIKYKCIEISRDVRGDEWSFDKNLNYVRVFDYEDEFLKEFSNLFAKGDTKLEELISNAIDGSLEFDTEASAYEMQENSTSSHEFWDEMKKSNYVKKMSKEELSNFYSWFFNFENVLKNNRGIIKNHGYEYYEFSKNIDFNNPVAVTSNIWVILFTAKKKAIKSCLQLSSEYSYRKSVIDYVMNPENFDNNDDTFKINTYWSFDIVKIEGQEKYKMSFDTARFVSEFFENQSEFEQEGVALEITTDWLDERGTRRRGFEIDSDVDPEHFAEEFKYRLLEDDISDEVLDYMKKNKCPITSSSQLNGVDEDINDDEINDE